MVLWIALAVLLVAVIGGVAYAAVRGFQLYRNGKRAGTTIGAEVDRISAVSFQIEHHAAQAEAASRRLSRAADGLAISRAQLEVQLAAIGEARAQVRRAFWFVPGI
jgi:hypothetical protein